MNTKRFEIGRPGSDPTLPDVSLAIDGKDYPLAFGFVEVAEVENLTGVNMLTAAMGEPGFQTTAALLHCAAKKATPEFTLKMAQGVVCVQNIFTITQAIRVAWGLSKPKPEPVVDGDDVSPGGVEAQTESPQV